MTKDLQRRVVPALAVLAVATGSGCVPIGASAQAGFTMVAVRGELALGSGGAASTAQDLDSGFGLGDERGSPWLRAEVDLGALVFTGSAFWLRESGQGVLNESFGGLTAATPVASELDLGVAKLSAVYDLDLGIAKLSPGLLVDVLDLEFRARDLVVGNREEVDEFLALPMPFVRVEAGLGPLRAIAEAGYLEVGGLGGNEGRFHDLEAMVQWPLAPLAHLFVGYRRLGIDASGDSGDDTFGVDVSIRGWTIGGGLRF
ncbi:MAG: hypothetical protein MUC36_13630 [Planctomycetes bacterium]|nr:hypothetical protein [Planctomycetota bacterium]